MEHTEDADIDTPLEGSSGTALEVDPVVGVPADVATVIQPDGNRTFAEPLGVGIDCKAVLVVAAHGRMSPGELASLCAHAAVGLYKVMMANRIPWYPAFEAQGEQTTILAAEASSELDVLADKASQLLLPTFAVSDNKNVAISSGKVLVLSIAGPSEAVDKITGRLQAVQ